MPRLKLIYDVFISHSARDRDVAEEIAAQLQEAGITAFFDVADSRVGENVEKRFWEALSESRALIAVFSDVGAYQFLGLAIGAAFAWNKPVFIVLNAPPTTRLPEILQSFPVFPVSRISDLVEHVLALQAPLGDEAVDALKDAYVHIGIPTDKLNTSPNSLQDLTKRVNERTASTHSGEVLLRELLRLRKRGELPRLRKAK